MQFSQIALFIVCNIFLSSCGYLFEMILHVKDAAWGFDTYHFTFSDKSLRVLCLDIWNKVLETLNAELS